MGVRLKIGTLAGAALAIAGIASPGLARDGVISFDRPGLAAPEMIGIQATAFPRGGAIPREYSSYDDNRSPELTWTGVPDGAASLALVIEDPDAPPAEPVVHWLVWNIPPTVTRLPAGFGSDQAGSADPIRQGRNSHGETGYYGPHPPKGDPAHRYFFQIYALDRMLDLPAGRPIADLVSALGGHVVARGEMVGTFARPDDPKHP